VCGPSRAGLITGRYGQRFGFERNPQYRTDDPGMGVPLDDTALADALGGVGYHCGVIGKWHLGAHPDLHPLERGFDEFFGHLGGGHKYLPELLTIQDSYAAEDEPQSYRTWILRNHTPSKPEKYLTDEFSDEAVAFIERNHARPFFLFLSYNAPHTPLQATEEYLARFPDIADQKRRTYAAMVSAVDDGVGRVLAALREAGVEDDTLVFFLSDNGGPETKNASDNGPLRDGKGSVYEGGHRVPFVVQWKAGLPGGTRYDEPVLSLDIFGTIAALSGAQTDPARPLDGVDLVPYLTGADPGRPHEAIYMRKFDSQAYMIRSGGHKVVIPFEDAEPQLFNLIEDIGEENDLAAGEPAMLEELQGQLDAWTADLIEPRFLGLIHTDAWQKRKNKRAADKKP